MRLRHIALEDITLTFAETSKDLELVEEIQILLRNAGCQIAEIDGFWNVNTYAAMGVFCAVHSLTTSGVTPQLARELLEYGELIDGKS